jgi:hypothetical protein
MAKTMRLGFVVIVLALGLVACANEKVAPTEQQVRDLAWQALEPNTASHNRAAWEFIEIKQVVGRDIAGQFTSNYFYGCLQGPTSVPNSQIDPSGVYWYVHMEPRPATPLPPKLKGPVGTGNPPIIPEPFMYKAFFLIDAADGKVVARNLSCLMP